MENINVSNENKNFQSIDGVLFNKELTQLIYYPMGKKATTYEIPAGTTHIKILAFLHNDILETVILPEKLTTIEDSAFCFCDKLRKIVIPDTVTTMEGEFIFYWSYGPIVYCKLNSVAHKYAENNVYTDYVIDDTAPTINKIEQDGSYISVTAEDNNNGVGIASKAYSLDGINWTEDSKIKVDETKIYTVYVRDQLNNVTTQDINIDVTKPTISNILVEQNIIKITATDNTKLAEKAYSLDGESWQSSNEFNVTKVGKYTIYVCDDAGNIATKMVEIVESKEDNDKSEKEDMTATGDDNNSSEKDEISTETNDVKKDEDKTQADTMLPQTGEKLPIVILIVVSIVAVVAYKKYKKVNY